ncbi:MAG: c-type cytochrome, partial [Proteobacteria bacterium]|nr:c-type cytochrome [Pseudomonadota bacterium]
MPSPAPSRHTPPLAAALALGLGLGLGVTASAQTADATTVARGAYLVHGMGCADCHTPLKMGAQGPEPDLARGLSGHPQGMVLQAPTLPAGSPWMWGGAVTNTAFWGPWGVSYAANLTPDATGLKDWTAEQFVQAMRTGKHAGSGRPLMPPMPWPAFGQLNDADLHAMFSYLMAQPAVPNRVPD